MAEIASFCAQEGIEGITLGLSQWKPQFIPVAEHYGLATFCFTVNDPATAEDLLAAGTDGIYTDTLLLNEE